MVPSNVEEIFSLSLPIGEEAEALARKKALAVAQAVGKSPPYDWVLAADTAVVLDGHLLGKPSHPQEAAEMLRRLSGRTHEVVTGVALVGLCGELRVESWHEITCVTFRPLRDAEIVAYVATGRPMDKAGAYGIQEEAAAFVTRIEGCYFNVVGLPLARLAERLFVEEGS